MIKQLNKLYYKPISCTFYDLLLSKTTLKEEVNIVYLESANIFVDALNVVIKTIITKDKAEYLILDSGKTIRLDHIISLNNIKLEGYGSCKF